MTNDTKMAFPDELIEQLLANYRKPEDLTGDGGILRQLTARLVELAPANWRATLEAPGVREQLAANIYRQVALGEPAPKLN